jgi:rare lipoprotein A (peptidoglycan hydrolase)
MQKKTFRGAIAIGAAVILAVPVFAPIHQAVALPKPGPSPEFAPESAPEFGPEFAPEFGRATWYGERFQGHSTASGEPFDMYQMTAAHRHFPLGSLVRVVNLATGRAIIVRVNDRGPVIPSTKIDLSYAAAEQLGIRVAGHAQVRLDLLSGN